MRERIYELTRVNGIVQPIFVMEHVFRVFQFYGPDFYHATDISK